MLATGPFLSVFLLAAYWPTIAAAHDIYHGLANSVGESCCNGVDCRPTSYRLSANGVQMFVNGDWIKIPASLIQYRTIPGDKGETAGGHWCGYTQLRSPEDQDAMVHHTVCA